MLSRFRAIMLARSYKVSVVGWLCFGRQRPVAKGGPGGKAPPDLRNLPLCPPTEMNFIYTYTYVYICVCIYICIIYIGCAPLANSSWLRAWADTLPYCFSFLSRL